MFDEGVIKFNCEWVKSKAPPEMEIKEINRLRSELYKFGFIGVYPNGIGFGNLSVRPKGKKSFLITGTQTGEIKNLKPEHYACVTDYDIEKNFVCCEGLIKASSESLTHAMIYDLDVTIKAVIHVHHEFLWQQLMDQVPTTDHKIPYGTPEMAREVRRIYQTTDLKERKIFVMGGHTHGMVTFGADLKEASAILFHYAKIKG